MYEPGSDEDDFHLETLGLEEEVLDADVELRDGEDNTIPELEHELVRVHVID